LKYPIVEHFYTLQGEGFFAGNAAYFIRLGGCDVGCVWCDTKESWDADLHQKFSTEEIVSWVKKTNANRVVITGGEPLMHDLTTLTTALKNENIELNLETSGSHSFSGKFDWVCLSPKKFKPALQENYQWANELKVIVFNQSDFEFALNEAKKVDKNCLLYLQAEWNKESAILPSIIEFIKQNPQWKLSLQTHKHLQIP
jgi:organic radical activating enzyme